MKNANSCITKRHESDYYLYDEETGIHYLIELKIGGDLDNKKARSEKESPGHRGAFFSSFQKTNCLLAQTSGILSANQRKGML